jgi:hypothetical protein
MAAGYGQAFASRYQTVALLFWFSVGCLVLAFAKRHWRFGAVAVQVLLLLVMVRGAFLLRFPLRDAREHAFQMRAATAALLTGINDRPQIAEAGSADQVLAVVPFMREQRLSIFAGKQAALLGTDMYPMARVANDDRCEAEVQTETLFRDADGRLVGLRVSGWVWDKERRRPANTILMVARGKIVGLGAVGDWRPTVRADHREINTSFIGFTAYAKGGLDLGVTPYATVGGMPAKACEIEYFLQDTNASGGGFEVSPQ